MLLTPCRRTSPRRRVVAGWVLVALVGVFGPIVPVAGYPDGSTALAAPAPPAPAAPVKAANCGLEISQGAGNLPERVWPLRRLQPELAWPLSRGRGVTVAVIDSGVSNEPPTLAGQVDAGTDFVQSGDGTCDNAAHGTFVAAIIAGKETEDGRYYGVAPDARILPVRVMNDGGRSTDQSLPQRIANAIKTAADRPGVKVINLSLTTVPVQAIVDAVAYARAKDIVLVAAAGNEGGSAQNGPVYPAAYEGVVAVAGIDELGQHVPSSSTGSHVDIAAPGLDIAGPAPRGKGFKRFEKGGTSFAAGYVSGVAALIRAYDPTMRAPEVIRRMTDTADHPAAGWDEQLGYGVVNPYRALATILADGRARPVARRASAMPDGGLNADPFAGARVIAGWTAGVGAGLSVAVLLGAAAIRRGRARRWRPGRRKLSEEPDPPAQPDS